MATTNEKAGEHAYLQQRLERMTRPGGEEFEEMLSRDAAGEDKTWAMAWEACRARYREEQLLAAHGPMREALEAVTATGDLLICYCSSGFECSACKALKQVRAALALAQKVTP